MELKKYKLGEILDVTRGASLSGEFYATEGKYIRLTIRTIVLKKTSQKIISTTSVISNLNF